jgi:nitrite reductase/ring-hydroxylating ferredoxin subunit
MAVGRPGRYSRQQETQMGQFIKVATTAEMEAVPAGKQVEAGGQVLALYRVGENYYAIENTCPHRGGPLAEGMQNGHEVTCPWHAARFDLRTGAALCPPAPRGVQCFAVRVSGGDVEVEV